MKTGDPGGFVCGYSRDHVSMSCRCAAWTSCTTSMPAGESFTMSMSSPPPSPPSSRVVCTTYTSPSILYHKSIL